MTFITDKIRANGWRDADLDVVARALIEAARREGSGLQKAIYAPMTDEQWRHHRHMQNLQFAFTDARTVLSALKREKQEVDEMSGLASGDDFGAAGVVHSSDCAVHNEPAYPAGPCNCGPGRLLRALVDLTKTDGNA